MHACTSGNSKPAQFRVGRAGTAGTAPGVHMRNGRQDRKPWVCGLNSHSTVTCSESALHFRFIKTLPVEGGLPLAQDGTERGTVWQLMAGREVPCLASRSVPRAAGGLRFTVHPRTCCSKVRSKISSRAGRSPARCRHPGSRRHPLSACCPRRLTYDVAHIYTQAQRQHAMRGEQCNPAGKSVSDVKLHM